MSFTEKLLRQVQNTLEKLNETLSTTPSTHTTQRAGDSAVQINQARDIIINAKSSPSVTESSQELEAYLRWLFHRTLELDLGGIDPKMREQRDACLDLPEIYTALLTMSAAEHEAHISEKRELPERERLRSAVEMLNAEKRAELYEDVTDMLLDTWFDSSGDLRSAYRYRYWPRFRSSDLGFRPVRIYV